MSEASLPKTPSRKAWWGEGFGVNENRGGEDGARAILMSVVILFSVNGLTAAVMGAMAAANAVRGGGRAFKRPSLLSPPLQGPLPGVSSAVLAFVVV
eukprot:scaffold5491_cov117-Isochrysis_galbana.AAC.7